ncbi:unnamed protein product [Dicrocoelium dendriticum]|nr:unnamed protein product [Dicrocoelium dendriticum]
MSIQMSNTNGDRAQINARLNELSSRKRRIEEEICQMNQILQSNGNVGMDSPLVDREGFPRSDIDVASVRTARNRIIHLNNDHKSVMLAMEEALNQMHQLMRTPNGVASPVANAELYGGSSSPQDVVVSTSLEPFLLVDEVKSESPAEHAVSVSLVASST